MDFVEVSLFFHEKVFLLLFGIKRGSDGLAWPEVVGEVFVFVNTCFFIS